MAFLVFPLERLYRCMRCALVLCVVSFLATCPARGYWPPLDKYWESGTQLVTTVREWASYVTFPWSKKTLYRVLAGSVIAAQVCPGDSAALFDTQGPVLVSLCPGRFFSPSDAGRIVSLYRRLMKQICAGQRAAKDDDCATGPYRDLLPLCVRTPCGVRVTPASARTMAAFIENLIQDACKRYGTKRWEDGCYDNAEDLKAQQCTEKLFCRHKSVRRCDIVPKDWEWLNGRRFCSWDWGLCPERYVKPQDMLEGQRTRALCTEALCRDAEEITLALR